MCDYKMLISCSSKVEREKSLGQPTPLLHAPKERANILMVAN